LPNFENLPVNIQAGLAYLKPPSNTYFGVYQIGEDQARSCMVAGTSVGGAIPKVFAS